MDEPSKPEGQFVPAPGPTTPVQVDVVVPEPEQNRKFLIPIVVFIVLAAYLALAYHKNWWPFWLAQSPTPSPVASLCPQPTPTNPTADWITYLDGAHCFSFQYPERVQLSEASNIAAGMLVTLNPPEGGQISVNEWAIPETRYANLSAPLDIQVGGVTARRYTYQQAGGCNGILVSFQSKGIEVNMDDCYVTGGSPNFPNQAQRDLFESILPTFQFTN